MKKLNLLIAFLAAMLLVGCEETKEIEFHPANVKAPRISSELKAVYPAFEMEHSHYIWEQLSWNAADFGVGFGVDYQLELSTDESFEEAVKILVTSKTETVISVSDINDAMVASGIKSGEEVKVFLRVVAKATGLQSDGSSNLPTVSPIASENILSTKLTCYEASFPSIYMIGAAVGGWDPGLAVEIASTGVPEEYSTYAYFDNSGEAYFRFFSFPDWGGNIGGVNIFTEYPTDLLQPQPGENSDNNFMFTGETGWYKIDVNQGSGSIAMKALDSEPVLYLTGGATHGWGWDADPLTQLNWVGHQTWEGTVTFSNSNFRFFEDASYDAINFGYDVLTEYDAGMLEPATGDSDPNFNFVGAPGTYTVRVDKRAGSVVIE
ncbi:SusE domain-containing protein [Limibacter armeniacum]|uniref:SusE domain-containing protein n=1 Tax=Limibacter armeniacum TaxID=466084 RepID=UPI002FE5F7E6